MKQGAYWVNGSSAHIHDPHHGNRSIHMSGCKQTDNSQTDRDVGVSTLGSIGGGGDWQGDEPGGDILHTNWTTGPPSSWFHSLYFSFRHPGSGSKTLFMRGYPSKSCGILLSNSRCFLHIVLKTVTQVKSNERSITLWRYEI